MQVCKTMGGFPDGDVSMGHNAQQCWHAMYTTVSVRYTAEISALPHKWQVFDRTLRRSTAGGNA